MGGGGEGLLLLDSCSSLDNQEVSLIGTERSASSNTACETRCALLGPLKGVGRQSVRNQNSGRTDLAWAKKEDWKPAWLAT